MSCTVSRPPSGIGQCRSLKSLVNFKRTRSYFLAVDENVYLIHASIPTSRPMVADADPVVGRSPIWVYSAPVLLDSERRSVLTETNQGSVKIEEYRGRIDPDWTSSNY